MASAYGILKKETEYIQPYDTNELMQIAALKQSKYDQNVELLNNELSKIVNLDLIKQEDKAYLNTRLDEVVSKLDRVQGIDLSSSAATRRVLGHLKQATDENVKAAIISTYNVRKDLSDIQAAKDRNDGTYSIANEAYLMNHINGYIGTNTITTPNHGYSSRGYTNYINVYEKKDKLAAEILKNKGETTVQLPGMRPGEIIEKKAKNLTESELESMILQSLTPEEQNQLSIDAWWKGGRRPVETTNAMYSKYMGAKEDAIVSNIGKIDNLIDTIKDPNIKNQWLTERNKLDKQLSDIRDSKEKITDPTTQSIILEQAYLTEGLVNKYITGNETITPKTDDVYFKNADLNISLSKLAIDQSKLEIEKGRFNLDVMKFQHQVEKDKLDEARKSGENTSEYVSLGVPAHTDDPLEMKKAIDSQIASSKLESDRHADTIYKELSSNPEFSSVLDATIRDIKNNSNTPINDVTARNLAIDSMLTTRGSKMYEALSPDGKKSVELYKSSKRLYEDQVKTLSGYMKEVIGENGTMTDYKKLNDLLTTGSSGIFGRGEASESIIMSNGKTLYDDMTDKNIRSEDAFEKYLKDNPAYAKEIQEKLLGDYFVNALTGFSVNSVSPIEGGDYTMKIVPGSTKDNVIVELPYGVTVTDVVAKVIPVVNRTNTELSTNIDVSSIIQPTTITDGTKGREYVKINMRDQSGFGKQIAGRLAKGIEVTNSRRKGSPGSFTEHARWNLKAQDLGINVNYGHAVRDAFKADETKTLELEAYRRAFGNIKQDRSYTFTKESNKKEHDILYAMLSTRGDVADKEKPISIVPVHGSPGEVVITQNVSKLKADGTKIPVSTEVRIPKVELARLSTFKDFDWSVVKPANNNMFSNSVVTPREADNYINTYQNPEVIKVFSELGIDPSLQDNATLTGVITTLSPFMADATPEIKKGVNSLIANPSKIKIGVGETSTNSIDIYSAATNSRLASIEYPQMDDNLRNAIRNSSNIGLTRTMSFLLYGYKVDPNKRDVLTKILNEYNQ